MEFLKYSDSLADFQFSYGAKKKTLAAAKILGITAANSAILAGKIVVKAGEQLAQQVEEQKKQ